MTTGQADKPKRYYPKVGDYKRRKCASCGQWRDCRWDVDPYRSEIGDDHTLMWECDDCRYESAMDI